jgi:hypothetical protein
MTGADFECNDLKLTDGALNRSAIPLPVSQDTMAGTP